MKPKPKHIRDRENFFKQLPKGGNVIELGVYKSHNAKRIYSIIKPTHLYLVDLFCDQPGPCNLQRDEAMWIMCKERAIEWADSTDNITLYCEDFDKVCLLFPDGFFDIVYLDGNHDYESVVKDLNLWYPKVKKGGYFAGHDYKDRRFKVRKAVDEFLEERSKEIDILGDDKYAGDYAFKNGED